MKLLVIDNGTDEIHIARLEDGAVTELAFENKTAESRVGNIYCAGVKNIVPAQFAFLNIGASSDAFLYLNDRKELNSRKNIIKGGEALVQVLKDETGGKGACVTTQITLKNKHFVIFKNYGEQEIAVSQKITEKDERLRLREIILSVLNNSPGYGVIIRTEAEGCAGEVLGASLISLIDKCEGIILSGIYKKAPCLVYKEESALIKLTESMMSRDIGKIIINNPEDGFLNHIESAYEKPVELYNEEKPIFEQYLIKSQADKAQDKKVWLKSGGYIIIEQTEACVTVDVNSGKFIYGPGHEKTVAKTNMEAADEIARQIRLRNLSGMIMVDFINNTDAGEIKRLEKRFAEALKRDRIPVNVICVPDLCVFLLTRKKVRESVQNIFTARCPRCGGSGRIKKQDL